MSRLLYAYFGHHKCASTWIESICELVCHELGIRFKIVYEARDVGYDLQGYVKDNDIEFLAFANAGYDQVKTLGSNVKAFHVVRDPRDIVVSAYYSHLKTHPTHAWPELVEYRKELQSLDKEAGILREIEFREEQFKEMSGWPESSEAPNIIEIKMEELTANPYEGFLDIFEFLGLVDNHEFAPSLRSKHLVSKVLRKIERLSGIKVPLAAFSQLPAERILGIVWEYGFKRITGGRKKGEVDETSHYRKGVAGDWVNELNAEHVEEIRSRYNSVIMKYGYELDPNWKI